MPVRALAALTTNHVARRAGVSIGTVYQYFPNLEALLASLAARQRQAAADVVLAQLEQSNLRSDDAARQLIRSLIKIMSARRNYQRNLVLNLMQRHQSGEADSVADTVAEAVRAKFAAEFAPETLSRTAAFVLTQAITGTVRAAMFDNPALLKDREFEDELVNLMNAFLARQPGFGTTGREAS